MMKTFTSRSFSGKISHVLICAIIILLTILSSKSYAQTSIYANTVVSSSNVTNPGNATTSDENTFAQLNSYGGIAIGLGSYTGDLELKFPANVPANTTTYVRIDSDPDLLNALLGGNLGGLLANVLGNVVLGNHSFTVGAKNAAGQTVLEGNSSGQFTSNNIRLIKDAAGRFFVAITPTQIYDRIFIRDITNAVLLGVSNNTKVHYAVHFSGSIPVPRHLQPVMKELAFLLMH